MDSKTTLHPIHLESGAKMVPFGGWDMPVQYSGILSEVAAVRTSVGLFDVSHMGRLYISGAGATSFLDWVLTSSASTLNVGKARYCMICNEIGGIIDDTIFYRLEENRYLLIPNAGNRLKVLDWFESWISNKSTDDCEISDQTLETCLIAIQGPASAKLLDQLCSLDSGHPPSSLKPFSCSEGVFQGRKTFIARTGYTGEDGFEIIIDSSDAIATWKDLINHNAIACGLGARDVLRLEAGLPLHGHEMSDTITPIEAGLARFTRSQGEFVGSDEINRQRIDGTERKLVGLKVLGRSAPRADYPISYQGLNVGYVTSGSYSPTLDTSIAMGYVLLRYANVGQTLDIDIRGRSVQAEIASLPFYSRPRRA